MIELMIANGVPPYDKLSPEMVSLKQCVVCLHKHCLVNLVLPVLCNDDEDFSYENQLSVSFLETLFQCYDCRSFHSHFLLY